MTDTRQNDWSGLVVFCAATNWDGNRFPDQHIAERLARYAPVLYVDPPVSVLAPWRDPTMRSAPQERGVRIVAPQLARITPVGPPRGGRRGAKALTHWATRRAMRAAVAELGAPPVHAVVAASFAPVFGICGERRRVLYSTDDFVAGADLIKVPHRSLVRDETRQLAAADIVVVCSPGLLDRYRGMGVDPVFVPNGCDDELFAATDDAPMPDDVDLPPPVAGFVGHLTDRIDATLLEAVAERGRSVLLVGPTSPSYDVSRLDGLLARANVRWVGRKPFDQLPSYLRAMDVGLLPYADSAFNRGSFPLKILEYLAAGRGAVSTGLPAIRWLDTDLVDIADEPEAFADAVDRALAVPRTADLVAARRALARRHAWSRRAREFAEAIGLDVADD